MTPLSGCGRISLWKDPEIKELFGDISFSWGTHPDDLEKDLYELLAIGDKIGLRTNELGLVRIETSLQDRDQGLRTTVYEASEIFYLSPL